MIARIKALLARVPARVKAQAARFARVFVFAAVPAAVAGWRVHHVLLGVLGAALTAGAEAVWRQLRLPPEAKQLLGLLDELRRHPVAPVPTTTNNVTATAVTRFADIPVTREAVGLPPALPVKKPAPAPTPAQMPAKKTAPKPPVAKKAAAAPAKKTAAKKT